MARNVVEKIELNLSALDQLLGSENVENVKKRIGDLIVDRVRSDLRSYDSYLFYPADYKESIESAFEKIEKKISKLYADAALECAQQAVQRFKDISLTALTETPGLVQMECHKCSHCDYNRCKFYDGYYWVARDNICAKEGFINFQEK